MTATSDLIESLISYSWDDWQVTRQEARRVIAAIRNDNVPDATIAALDKSGSLIKLFQRVGPPELARSLIASIAGRTTMQRYQARNALIRSLINNPLGTQTDNWIYFPTITFFDICADLADARRSPGLRRGGSHRGGQPGDPGSVQRGRRHRRQSDRPAVHCLRRPAQAAQQGPGDRHQVQQPARRPGRLPEPAVAARQAEPGTDAGRPADQHAVPRRLSGQPRRRGPRSCPRPRASTT
ncbi:Uncharacterised protein [Pseudomonas aeruginosa]|nr:Uncharacterised protein [Pseudomonas aeruginosa]